MAQQRQAQEKTQQFAEYATKQDELLKEHVPELADTAKAKKLQEDAVKVLTRIGFTQEELAKAWNEDRLFRDHRIQRLIVDAVRLEQMQQNKAKIPDKAKPVPPVQRPGVPPVRGAHKEAELKSLADRIEQASSAQTGVRAAAEYLRARRAAVTQ